MIALSELGRLLAGGGSLLLGGLSPAWIRAGVTALSVLLTGGLVYLYHEQRKLDALEYTADVQTEGHRPSDDGTALEVCLSNLGRGAATDLRLCVTSVFVDADGYRGRAVETEPIKRLRSSGDGDVASDWVRPARNYIGPQRDFVEYRTPIPVKWTDPAGAEHGTSLRDLPAELPESVDRFRLVVTLRYRDHLDNRSSRRIVDDVLPLERERSLRFLFSRGMTYDESERRKANDGISDPFESLVLHRPQLTDESWTGRQHERENG